MNLSPQFVLWDLTFFTLLLINGSILWLVTHRVLLAVLRRVWLGDLIWVWLAYAAGYHLWFYAIGPGPRGAALGGLWAVWGLCGYLACTLALRLLLAALAVLPDKLPGLLFSLAVIAWALVIGAGDRHVDALSGDLTLLRNEPERIWAPDSPSTGVLERALTLSRLEESSRRITAQLLSALKKSALEKAPLENTTLENTGLPPPELLATFRLQTRRNLLLDYERNILKLRTYQWVQWILLAALLLVWGFGRVAEWEPL